MSKTYHGIHIHADSEATLLNYIEEWLNPWHTTRKRVKEASEDEFDEVHFATLQVADFEPHHLDEAGLRNYLASLRRRIPDHHRAG